MEYWNNDTPILQGHIGIMDILELPKTRPATQSVAILYKNLIEK